jgi:hypothetical protein
MYWEDEEFEERDEEPQELPQVVLDEPGSCVVCGKLGRGYGCFRCGQPVCINADDYFADSACGGWILDWWTDGAYDPDDGNEFYCNHCLEEVNAQFDEVVQI